MNSKYYEKHEHYRIGRLPHHAAIRTYFEEHFASDGTVLELGAGTGLGTEHLASYFASVIAVEPVTAMLACAADCVKQSNVTWLNLAVEQLDPHRLDHDYLICFQATHWLYGTSTYHRLFRDAQQPVLDICSFLSFPEDACFFDELAQEYTVLNANRGTAYPHVVEASFLYVQSIGAEQAAHQLASRSWADHTLYPEILARISDRYGSRQISVSVETRVHNVQVEA